MANRHKHYTAFVQLKKLQGFTDEYEISQMDGAADAAESDRRDEILEDSHKSKADWLQAGRDGVPQVAFTTQAEMIAAMNDQRYKTMPNYRAAVQDCVARMEHVGVAIGSGESAAQDGFSMEGMIKQARKDVAISEYKRLSVAAAHDPKERLALLELLNSKDPAVQEWINEGTGAVANEGPGQKMMREAGSGTFGPNLGAAMANGEDKGTDPANAPVGA